jgi:hypothetical protein
MGKELTIHDAIKRQEWKAAQPGGFYAVQSVTGKYWDIYFKLSTNSHSEIILLNLTEKKAKAKAESLNSILATK